MSKLPITESLDPSDPATEGRLRDQVIRISKSNGMVLQLIEQSTREYILLYKTAEHVTWRDQLDHTMRALGTVWLDPLKPRPLDESNLIDHGFYALYLGRKQWLAREAKFIQRGFQVMARGVLISPQKEAQQIKADESSTEDAG